MGRPPGSGRVKGVPNNITRDIREQMRKFAERRTPEELEKLWKEMVKASPGKALEIYVKLCEYFVPKLARHEVTGPNGEGPAIVERVEYVRALPASAAVLAAEVADAVQEPPAG